VLDNTESDVHINNPANKQMPKAIRLHYRNECLISSAGELTNYSSRPRRYSRLIDIVLLTKMLADVLGDTLDRDNYKIKRSTVPATPVLLEAVP
jgi:hypothetical protein